MAKSKTKTKTKNKTTAAHKSSAIPLPPVIYINDGVSGDTPYHAFPFYKLIPKLSHAHVTHSFEKDTVTKLLESTKADSAVAVFISARSSTSTYVEETADGIKKTCIANGRNFLSVNFHPSGFPAPKAGTAQHLNYAIKDQSPDTAAKAVLKWMFSTLAPVETTHLIPAADFLAIDTTSFPGYAYCPISQARAHPKDAKIQFVVVITTKPVVSEEGNKLTWSVADKTQVANFYFVHTGEESQETWDWVLKLQPGQRVALGRQPCVEVKEGWGLRMVKAPFRAVGYGLMVPGKVLVATGSGLQKVAEKVSMGKAKKWVARDDVVGDGKGGREGEEEWEKVNREWNEKRLEGKEGAKDVVEEWSVFDEKGRWAWGSDDDDAGTETGSVCGGNAEKEV